MFGLLKTAASIESLPADAVDPEYRRLRRQVFAGIFVGYAAFYLVRNNLALAIPDILREYPQYSKASLGTVLTGSSIAYGVSKFLMGSVSDRSNPRYFLPLGLLLSSAIIFACGAVKGIYASFVILVLLQTLNGWVQGMGWPACGKTMVHWFSTRERGVVVSVWNTAHNVGGALVANLAVVGVIRRSRAASRRSKRSGTTIRPTTTPATSATAPSRRFFSSTSSTTGTCGPSRSRMPSSTACATGW